MTKKIALNKLIAYIAIIVIVAAAALFAFRKISAFQFWIVAAVIAFIAYIWLPKLKK